MKSLRKWWLYFPAPPPQAAVRIEKPINSPQGSHDGRGDPIVVTSQAWAPRIHSKRILSNPSWITDVLLSLFCHTLCIRKHGLDQEIFIPPTLNLFWRKSFLLWPLASHKILKMWPFYDKARFKLTLTRTFPKVQNVGGSNIKKKKMKKVFFSKHFFFSFSKDTLNVLKVTVKASIMLQKTSVSNKCCSFEHSVYQTILEKVHRQYYVRNILYVHSGSSGAMFH